MLFGSSGTNNGFIQVHFLQLHHRQLVGQYLQLKCDLDVVQHASRSFMNEWWTARVKLTIGDWTSVKWYPVGRSTIKISGCCVVDVIQVLYNMFDAYVEMGQENIQYTDILSGFASFLVVALGGTLIGVIWGFLTGFVTRFTNHVLIIEPIFIFVMSYLAYLNAEIFHMSGILA